MSIVYAGALGNISLSRDAMLASANTATIMAWLYPTGLPVSGDPYNNALAENAAGSGNGVGISMFYTAGAVKWNLGTETTDNPGSLVSVNTWAHLTLVKSASNAQEMFLNGVSDATDTASYGGTTVIIGNYATFAANANSFIGRIACAKVWDAVLTAEEIVQEMRRHLPVRTTNIKAFYPLYSATDVVDYSGQAQTLTTNGAAPTSADGPPIPWASAPWRIISVPLGGSATITPPMLSAATSLLTPIVTGTDIRALPSMVVTASSVLTPNVMTPRKPSMLTLASRLGTSRPSSVTYGIAAFTATNAATITPALPIGWQVGDIHLLIAARSDNTAMSDPGNRWTLLSAGNNTVGQRVELWWRLAQAGDTAPAITFGSSTVVRGAMIVGVEAGTPVGTGPFVGITRSDKSDVSAATVTFADLTPSEPDTVLVALYAYEDDPSVASTISGWTPFFVATSALGTDMSLGVASRTYSPDDAATGALTTTVSTGTFANSPSVGFLIAIERTLVPVIITPAMVQATVSQLTPTVTVSSGGQSATVTPAMLSLVASQLTPTFLATRSPVVAPSMLVATSSLLSATGTGSITATAVPGQLVATSSLLTPVVAATRAPIILPAMLAAAVSQLTPTLLATRSSLITPSMLSATVTLLDATATAGTISTVTPAMLSVTTSLPTPTALATRAITVTPSLLTATASLLTPVASGVRAATVQPAILLAATSQLDATVITQRSATITPAMVAATVTLLTPSVSVGVIVAPSMLTLAVTQLTPSIVITGSVIVTPPILTLVASQPTPVVATERSATLDVPMLTLVASQLDATVLPELGVTAEPPMLTLVSSLLDPAIITTGGVLVRPAMLTLAISMPLAIVGYLPTVDGPTGVIMMSSGVSGVIIGTTGERRALVLATGITSATVLTSGVTSVIMQRTGEHAAVVTDTGEHTATVLDTGVRRALMAA